MTELLKNDLGSMDAISSKPTKILLNKIKQLNLHLFLGICLVCFSAISCNEEDAPPTKEELLAASTWKIQSIVVDPGISMNGITISDVMLLSPDEVKNYTYKFNLDGSLIQSGQSGAISESTWSLNSDETQIECVPGIIFTYPVVGSIIFSSIDLVSVTASQVVSTIPYTYDGTDYLVSVTFNSI